MRFGVALPHYTEQASSALISDVALAAEQLGFDSVWVSDHIVYPDTPELASSNTIFEPLAVLSYLAGITRRVRLGTSVLVAPHRHPIVAAKTMATIDVLSGGRLLPCFGTGGIQGEFEALGLPWRERGAMTDECIQAMRELWTRQPATFHGRYFNFDRMKCSPKPVQQPMPVWIGGNTKRAIRRVVELGDGWHPIRRSPEALGPLLAHMRTLCAQRGRAVMPEVSIRMAMRVFDGAVAGERRPLYGTIDQVVGDLERYREVGVGHVILDLLADPPRIVEAMMRFAQDVRPRLAE